MSLSPAVPTMTLSPSRTPTSLRTAHAPRDGNHPALRLQHDPLEGRRIAGAGACDEKREMFASSGLARGERLLEVARHHRREVCCLSCHQRSLSVLHTLFTTPQRAKALIRISGETDTPDDDALFRRIDRFFEMTGRRKRK